MSKSRILSIAVVVLSCAFVAGFAASCGTTESAAGAGTASASSSCCARTLEIVADMPACCKGGYGLVAGGPGACCKAKAADGTPTNDCCKKAAELVASVPSDCCRGTLTGIGVAPCCKESGMVVAQ